MANWCYNTVWFTGEPNVINSLTCFLYELAQEGRRKGHGQLPDFITRKEGWIFELGWSGEFYFYTTKWKPNTNVLIEIADRYGLNFRHEYEETGNRIFGFQPTKMVYSERPTSTQRILKHIVTTRIPKPTNSRTLTTKAATRYCKFCLNENQPFKS
jgi:hypothetical protein